MAFRILTKLAFLLLVLIAVTGCSQAPDWTLADEKAPDISGHWVAYPKLFTIDIESDDEGYAVKGGAMVSVDKSQHKVTFSGRATTDGRIVSMVGDIDEGKSKTKGMSLVMLGAYKSYDSEDAFLDGENLFSDSDMPLKGSVTVLVMRCGLASKGSFETQDWESRWNSIKHGTTQQLILQPDS